MLVCAGCTDIQNVTLLNPPPQSVFPPPAPLEVSSPTPEEEVFEASDSPPLPPGWQCVPDITHRRAFTVISDWWEHVCEPAFNADNPHGWPFKDVWVPQTEGLRPLSDLAQLLAGRKVGSARFRAVATTCNLTLSSALPNRFHLTDPSHNRSACSATA